MGFGFFNKISHGAKHFFKKIEHGTNNLFTKIEHGGQKIGSFIHDQGNNLADVGRKIGNSLEKAIPILSGIATAGSIAIGQPELGIGIMAASNMGNQLASGLKSGSNDLRKISNMAPNKINNVSSQIKGNAQNIKGQILNNF